MHKLWVIMVVLLSSACTTLPTQDFKESQSGITLRPRMARLPLLKKTEFPDPRLGVAYVYQDDKIAACTVYIYNAGYSVIEQGITSEFIKQEFARGKMEGVQAKAAGLYQSFSEIGNAEKIVKTKGGPVSYLENTYDFTAQGSAQRAHLLMTGANNHFVKVRCAYPKQFAAQGLNAYEKLVVELSEGIKSNASSSINHF